MTLERELAKLALAARLAQEAPARFGTVASVTGSTVMVIPDSASSEEVGPLEVMSGSPAVDDRVLILRCVGGLEVVIAKGGAGGGMTLITETVFAVDTAAPVVVHANIPQTFKGLLLEIQGCEASTSNSEDMDLYVNDDVGANYGWMSRYGTNGYQDPPWEGLSTPPHTGGLFLWYLERSNDASNWFTGRYWLPDYARSGVRKHLRGEVVTKKWTSVDGHFFEMVEVQGQWWGTAAITKLEIQGSFLTFKSGSRIALYGY